MNQDQMDSLTVTVLVVVSLVFISLHVFFNVPFFNYLWYPLLGVFIALSLIIAETEKKRFSKEIFLFKVLLDTYMFIVGYILLSIGNVQLNGINSSFGVVFSFFGVTSIALVMSFQQGVVGLSKSEQIILSFISIVLIVLFIIGNITLPWQVSVVLVVLGATGIGFKALGYLLSSPTQG